MIRQWILSATLPVFLMSCVASSQQNEVVLPVPDAWQQSASAAVIQRDQSQWWTQFESADLNTLIDQAMANNQSLQIAQARLAQSQAAYQGTLGNRWPFLSASASASQRDSETTGVTDSAQAGLALSYTPDLWGSRAASILASEANLDASEFALADSQLQIQYEVTAQYLNWLATQDRLAIAELNLASARQTLSLVEVQARSGSLSDLELARQRSAVLSMEASIPALEQQMEQSALALSLLTGVLPGELSLSGQGLDDVTLPTLSVLSPEQMMLRRPDVQQAEALLRASNANLDQARTELLPQLRLTADSTVSNLIDGPSTVVNSLLASLTQSVFQGGQLQAQVSLAEAQQREVVANYVYAAMDAYRDVESQLLAREKQSERQVLLEAQVTQAQRAFEIAQARYEAGADDLLTLLDSQRTLLSAEDNLVQARLSSLDAQSALFRALGG